MRSITFADISQINLSITTHVAAAGNPNVSILYDCELHTRLARYARERTPNVDYYQMLSALQVDILRMIAQWRAQSMSANAPPPAKKGGENEEKGSGKERPVARALSGARMGKAMLLMRW